MQKKPNLLFLGIDSLRRDHMSMFGYSRLTTPHMDKFFAKGTIFSDCYSPHIPTTPGYSNMLTGYDCFGTDVVALRHKGDLAPGVETLAEMLRTQGYDTTCVGFKGNVGGRGFDNYLEFSGWGSWDTGRSPKAENLNAVTLPEMERLAAGEKPFFLFLRHMDPHSPYLAPEPFHRMFYQGDEFDKNNTSLDPVYRFKPFCDYFASWFPPGCTDKDYIVAQYDAEVAYMDACIQILFEKLEQLGLVDNTLVVMSSDHGETLYDHDCYFDHHGLYEPTLVVPFALRFPGKVPEGVRVDSTCQLKDVTPTVLEALGIAVDKKFDGRSLMPFARGEQLEEEPEFYITECTWERKHGWRTPQYKYIEALEPDLHFREMVELYDIIRDPLEQNNIAEQEPQIVAALKARMDAFIAKRTKETGRENPMLTNLDWHGKGCGAFTSSQQAYDAMHIGDPESARKLQAMLAEKDK